MADWQIGLLGGLAVFAAVTLHNIFVELRSIRRMMNADRRIPNEVVSRYE
jgi:hypothetical protein